MTEYQRRRDLQALALAEREANAWAATVAGIVDEAALARLQRDEVEAAEAAARQALGEAQRREPLSFGGDWEPQRGPLGAYQAYVSATAAADEARQALAVAEAPLAPAQRQLALWQGERDRLHAASAASIEAGPLPNANQLPDELPEAEVPGIASPVMPPAAPVRRARLSLGPARWRWGGRHA